MLTCARSPGTWCRMRFARSYSLPKWSAPRIVDPIGPQISRCSCTRPSCMRNSNGGIAYTRLRPESFEYIGV